MDQAVSSFFSKAGFLLCHGWSLFQHKIVWGKSLVNQFMLKVSCTIIAMNEADRIQRTIQSLHGLVDEVLVVDSGSTDGTQSMAEALGARVIFNAWRGFGPQKRFAEDMAAHDIILNLDADEWLPEELRAELLHHLSQPTLPAGSFKMRMKMVYPGCEKPYPFADFHNYVRLYDRRKTRFADSLAHDEVQPTADAIQLKAPAYHQSSRSIQHIIDKSKYYYGLQIDEGKRKSKLGLTLRLLIEFPTQFAKFYFFRRHIFGGVYGIKFAAAAAYSRLLRIWYLRRALAL
jgi:glycosyltransferase involved in cell wall biosynthesis